MSNPIPAQIVLLPCPFCGDNGEKGEQQVTMMNAERSVFNRVICRCCGAMAPELNWQSRAHNQIVSGDPGDCPELNMSNFDNDDVSALNEWAIQARCYIDHIVDANKMVPASFDDKALEIARLIDREIYQKPATAIGWGPSQRISFIQCAVINAIRWADPSRSE